MAYRDDLEAAQYRIAELERELADSRAEVAALKGHRAEALAVAGEQALAYHPGRRSAERWLGAPVMLRFSRVIAGEVPEEAFAELVDRIQEILAVPGQPGRVGGLLTWSTSPPYKGIGPYVSVVVTVRDGETEIRVEERLANLAGAIFGGFGIGLGSAGAAAAAVAAGSLSPLLLLAAIPVTLASIYGGCRRLFRVRARRHADTLQTLFDELVALAEARAVPKRAPAAGR